MIAVDFSDIDWRLLRKVPFTTWFRFARVAQKKQAVLIVLMSCSVAHSSADTTVQMSLDRAFWSSRTEHSAAIAESAQKNNVKRNKTQLKKSESGDEFFTPKEQFLFLVNQPKCGNAAGAPPKKSGNSRREQNTIIEESNNRPIISRAHLFEGAECEVEIRRQKKPAQRVSPDFTAISNCK